LNIDNKNTILFVDLDDTLVDTSSFKRALFLSLSEYFKISFKKLSVFILNLKTLVMKIFLLDFAER